MLGRRGRREFMEDWRRLPKGFADGEKRNGFKKRRKNKKQGEEQRPTLTNEMNSKKKMKKKMTKKQNASPSSCTHTHVCKKEDTATKKATKRKLTVS